MGKKRGNFNLKSWINKNRLVSFIIVGILSVWFGAIALTLTNINKEDPKEQAFAKEETRPVFSNRKIVDLINQERHKKKLPSFKSNAQLNKAAKKAIKKIKKLNSNKNPYLSSEFDSYINSSGYPFQLYSYSYTWSKLGNKDIVAIYKNGKSPSTFIFAKDYTDIGIALTDSIVDGYPVKMVIVILASSRTGENQINYNNSYNYDEIDLNPNKYNLDPKDYTVDSLDFEYTPPETSAPTPPTPKYTYADAYRIALNNCAQFGNSSAYQQCIQAYLRKFGY